MELSALSLRLRALSVLRGLLSHPLVRAYGDTLTALDGTAADFADRYGALCATRFSCGDIAVSPTSRNGPWAVPKSFKSSYTETFSLQKCKNRDTCSRFLRICEANSILRALPRE